MSQEYKQHPERFPSSPPCESPEQVRVGDIVLVFYTGVDQVAVGEYLSDAAAHAQAQALSQRASSSHICVVCCCA